MLTQLHNNEATTLLIPVRLDPPGSQCCHQLSPEISSIIDLSSSTNVRLNPEDADTTDLLRF
jgi:hypothetical protein